MSEQRGITPDRLSHTYRELCVKEAIEIKSKSGKVPPFMSCCGGICKREAWHSELVSFDLRARSHARTHTRTHTHAHTRTHLHLHLHTDIYTEKHTHTHTLG